MASRGLRTGTLPIVSNCHKLCSDIFRFQRRVAVFQQHFNYFTEITVKFIERFAL